MFSTWMTLCSTTACGGGRPGDADRHPDVAPIHAAEATFVAHDPQLVRDHRRAVLSGVVHVVGMDHVVEGATEQRGRVGADQLAQRRVAGDDHTVQPGHGHAHRRVVERAVHGRVQGARREERHLRSYPRVARGRLWPGPADSELTRRSRTRNCRCTCIGAPTGLSLPPLPEAPPTSPPSRPGARRPPVSGAGLRRPCPAGAGRDGAPSRPVQAERAPRPRGAAALGARPARPRRRTARRRSGRARA